MEQAKHTYTQEKIARETKLVANRKRQVGSSAISCFVYLFRIYFIFLNPFMSSKSCAKNWRIWSMMRKTWWRPVRKRRSCRRLLIRYPLHTSLAQSWSGYGLVVLPQDYDSAKSAIALWRKEIGNLCHQAEVSLVIMDKVAGELVCLSGGLGNPAHTRARTTVP